MLALNSVSNFTNFTIIGRTFINDTMIPSYKFEFVPLWNLGRIADSCDIRPPYATGYVLYILFLPFEKSNLPRNLSFYNSWNFSDVIGEVQTFQPLEILNTIHGQRPVVRFQITDGRFYSSTLYLNL